MKNRTSPIASWARRPGLNPYEVGQKSASKIGSSTSLAAVCTILSRTAEMPKLLSFPERFGIRPLARGQRTVGACLELLTELGEDTVDAHLLDSLAGLAINTGGL